MIRSILLGVIFILTSAFATQAQLYIYLDENGNKVLTDQPPPDEARNVSSYKPIDPATRSTAPPPIDSYIDTSPSQQIISGRPAYDVPQSKAVDTHQLGLIRRGMGQSEVRRRLGEPMDIVPLGDRSVFYRNYGGSLVKSTATRERWVYPAGRGADPASITFENGRVVAKGRER